MREDCGLRLGASGPLMAEWWQILRVGIPIVSKRSGWLALLVAMAAAALSDAAPTDRAASSWVETEQTQIRLVAARDGIGDSAIMTLGLHVRLEDGWKIYWRSPGDAGIPPHFDWQGSTNLAAANVRWPLPHRFRLFDLDTFGYTGEVVLPVDVKLAEAGKPLSARLTLDYGICREVCIPYEASFSLDVPAGSSQPSIYAPLIERYLARVPGKTDGDLTITEVRLVENAGARTLVVEARAGQVLAKPDLVVEGPAGISFAAPLLILADAGHKVTFHSVVGGAKSIALTGRDLTLTLIDGVRAVERTIRVPFGSP
jgi:suppressor for copper-sensitivity B